MPKAYSMDLLKRVIEASEQGQTIVEVARRFAVSPSFIEKLQQRWREHVTWKPKAHGGGGRQTRLSPEHEKTFRALLAAQLDTTLADLRDKLGLKVHLSTLWYRLQRLGLTFKKTLKAAEQAREDIRLQRDAWQAAQPTLDPARLVFIDERARYRDGAPLWLGRMRTPGPAPSPARALAHQHLRGRLTPTEPNGPLWSCQAL